MKPSHLDSFDRAFAPPQRTKPGDVCERGVVAVGRWLLRSLAPATGSSFRGPPPRPRADIGCEAWDGRLWRVGEWPADAPSPPRPRR
jgi:hypothetical protein